MHSEIFTFLTIIIITIFVVLVAQLLAVDMLCTNSRIKGKKGAKWLKWKVPSIDAVHRYIELIDLRLYFSTQGSAKKTVQPFLFSLIIVYVAGLHDDKLVEQFHFLFKINRI